jgi:hypothetical protein
MFAQKFFSEDYTINGFCFKNLTFIEKRSGDQHGCIARVLLLQDETGVFSHHNFFIKTHENGISRNRYYSEVLDPREVFLYKFLEFTKIGAQVYFFFDLTNYKNAFIVSKEVEDEFLNFSFSANNSAFLTEIQDTTNRNQKLYLKSLIFMEIISKICFLADINDNFSNFGYLRCVKTCFDVRIIDFVISKVFIQEHSVEDMLVRFKLPNISTHNKKKNSAAIIGLFTVDQVEKERLAREIFSHQEFPNLLMCFRDARLFTDEFIRTHRVKMRQNNEDDYDFNQRAYDRYLGLVESNINSFTAAFTIVDP